MLAQRASEPFPDIIPKEVAASAARSVSFIAKGTPPSRLASQATAGTKGGGLEQKMPSKAPTDGIASKALIEKLTSCSNRWTRFLGFDGTKWMTRLRPTPLIFSNLYSRPRYPS